MVEYSGRGHRAKDACSLLRFLGRTSSGALRTIGAPIFFAFAGDTHWNAENRAAGDSPDSPLEENGFENFSSAMPRHGIVNLANRGRLFPAPLGLSGAAQ